VTTHVFVDQCILDNLSPPWFDAKAMTACVEVTACPHVRRVGDVDGRYSNTTRQQLQLYAEELRCQVNNDVIR